jgi:hypothetical protein
MKTFTATQLNKAPQEIFAAAKEDGVVEIKHDRYAGVKFTITAEKEVKGCKHVCDEKTMVCNICGEQCYRFEKNPLPPMIAMPPPLSYRYD